MLTRIYSDTTAIADGITALAGPVRMPAENAVQVRTPLRALGPVNIDRVGKSYEVSFTVLRLHADVITAANFRASHNEALPNVADLVMEWESGSTTIRATITAAAWQSVDPELIGISTRTSYVVTGGPLVLVDLTGSRITEAGDVRITEAGDTRIPES